MATTINNENQAARNHRVLASEGDVFSFFNVENFAVPHGKGEEWEFTPLRKFRGLHNGTATDLVVASILVETAGQDGVAVDIVRHDNKRLDRADTPTGRVAARTHSNFDGAHVVTFAKNPVSKESVIIDIDGPGEDSVSYGHIAINVQPYAEAICIVNYRGSGTFVDNIEFAIGNDAKLSVVTMMNWNEDAVHGSAYHACVSRDVTLRYTVTTFGGGVTRTAPRVAFAIPSDDVDPLGTYFAGAGQYFEDRMLVDYAALNRRSNVMYKGVLQSESNVAYREARAAQVGDILIRAEATDVDTYKPDRNLLLTEGTRVDAVPDLEIEIGEIAGAGHVAIAGRSDEEQLFYLFSRGIPELVARRLVVRGFFSKVINLISVESVREKLEKLANEGLNTVGS